MMQLSQPAQDHDIGGTERGDHCIALSMPCDLLSVRAGLRRVDQNLRRTGISSDCREDANLVLAEVLANIARHSGCGMGEEIALTIEIGPRGLTCHIGDPGRPFDPLLLGQTLPRPEDLCEGGYGWFLIHKLVRGLEYSHKDGLNVMTFTIPDKGASI